MPRGIGKYQLLPHQLMLQGVKTKAKEFSSSNQNDLIQI